MAETISPLATPLPWDIVAAGYVSDTVPLFVHYAADALRLAELSGGATIADIATGPGTLALLAAPYCHRVVAVDFAPSMIAQLRLRAQSQDITNVEGVMGDGQALALESDCFDAVFSMFGVIFFPDRAAGFRELYRILKPSGRAVVSSWTPHEEVPALAATFDALRAEMPEMGFGKVAFPLSTPAEVEAEMGAAGFESIVVHAIGHDRHYASPTEYWESFVRGGAPLALLRSRLEPDAWARVDHGVANRLTDHFGPGPLTVRWTANLGVGRKP